MRGSLVAALAVVPIASLGGRAEAFPERVGHLPVAPQSCFMCHESGGGSDLTVFGVDAEDSIRNNVVQWALLCPLDSDRDNFTNGEELNDPTCAFRIGDPPPKGPFSDPNSARSTPLTVRADAGVEDAPAQGEDLGTDVGPAGGDIASDDAAGPGITDAGPESDASREDASPASRPDLGPPSPFLGRSSCQTGFSEASLLGYAWAFGAWAVSRRRGRDHRLRRDRRSVRQLKNDAPR